jgi:uncharacterized protein YkwD
VRLISAAVLLVALALPAAASAAPFPDNLLAPESACPGQGLGNAPAAKQARTMLCLTNYARQRKGLGPLRTAKPLARAAVHKSADILACDEFDHEACGREFTYWMQRFGYIGQGCWAAGENIAYGTGPLGTPRSIFRSWLHSTGHRENILGKYTQIGIALRVGTLEGNAGAHVWTQDFGSHACG